MVQSQLHELTLLATRRAYPDIALPQFVVSHPENEDHGDYSVNIALVLARQINQSSSSVADNILSNFGPMAIVDRVEIAGPGFINFYLKPNFFWSHVEQAIELASNYGRDQAVSGKRIIFEYGQPNTHKVAHIGHLYSYCYGESCSRLLEATGSDVIRANYQGDIGPHVAKCLFAYLKNNLPDPESLSDKVAYLQECYQQGSTAYDDPEISHEIDELNRRLYRHDPEIISVWEKTRQWSLDAYREFEARLGIHYDRHYLESEVYSAGTKAVTDAVGKYFLQDDGAIIFRGEPYGLHTRVFVNRHGNPTYEAKDIGLIQKKREEYDFDLAIVETGNDQKEYWQVVKQAIELLFPEIIGKLTTLHHGMVNLSTGKMSSRSGEILTAFSLVENVKDRIRTFINEHRDYPDSEVERIAEIVAIGAIKYSLLRSSAGRDLMFDIETSISFEGNSGPYLQYTYARCQSVLVKSNFSEANVNALSELPLDKLEPKELALLRYIYRYGETMNEAATSYAPHMLATYLFELASRFGAFYGEHHIITDNEATTELRLSLTAATSQVLKNGLHLLGIDVADRI